MSTIKQKSAFVQIEGGQRIEVRRMRWKATRAMLKMLGDSVAKLYSSEGASLQEVAAAETLAAAAGAAQGFLPRIAALMQQSDEMLMHLAKAARRYRLIRQSDAPVELEARINLRTRHPLRMTIARRE